MVLQRNTTKLLDYSQPLHVLGHSDHYNVAALVDAQPGYRSIANITAILHNELALSLAKNIEMEYLSSLDCHCGMD